MRFYKGVIFDFNGTLFFDNPKHILAWSKISQDIRNHGISEEELHEHINGVPNHKVVAYMFHGQCTEEQMKNRLHGIPDFIKETLGDIKVTSKKERFCFYIPEEGSNYVHENTNPNEFIKELVEIVGKHGCKMEDIIALFKKHDKNVFVEEIHNGEFDYLIRFSEENEDPYYYCFHDEGCHIIYHRFLPEDYEDFGF